MVTLYLHVGMHKTGTSSLQVTFHAARKQLLGRGILYADANVNHSDLYLPFCDRAEKEHANMRRGISTRSQADERNQTILKRYAECLASADAKKIVISGEELSRLPHRGVEDLRRFLGNFASDFHVIVFVRSPISFSTSYSQQAIQGGSTMAIELQHPVLPAYRFKIEKFISIFGFANVEVVDFDESCKQNQGILRRFVRALQEKEELLELLPEKRQNKSLSLNAVHVLSKINELFPVLTDNGINMNWKGTQTALALLRKLSGASFSMPPAWETIVMERSHEDVVWLHENFGIDYRGVHAKAEAVIPSLPKAMIDDLAHIIYEAALKIEDFLTEYVSLRAEMAAEHGEITLARELDARLRFLKGYDTNIQSTSHGN